VSYWLVNIGTTEDPWLDRLMERYRAWNEQHGDAQMFPFRPKSVAVGDVLIHRVVGSPACGLIAVGVVVKGAHPSRDARWPWQIGRHLLYVFPTLAAAPTADEAGIAAKGLRVTKRLFDEQGRTAESLILAAGRAFTQQ
jgi:hypothetical protein